MMNVVTRLTLCTKFWSIDSHSLLMIAHDYQGPKKDVGEAKADQSPTTGE